MLLWLFLACAGADGDKETGGTDPLPFACGDSTCDARAEYCYSVTGGVPDTDGEAVTNQSCQALPEECLEAPTCACLLAADGGGGGMDCEAIDGAIYVSLVAP